LVIVSDAGGTAPQSSSLQDKASPEFTKDLEETVQRREDPIENLPVIETCEKLPKAKIFLPQSLPSITVLVHLTGENC
jgi:hypothetical protein